MSALEELVLQPFIRRMESVTRLSELEKAAIRRLPIHRTALEADQDIVREGDDPTKMFFIIEGMTASYKLVNESRRQIVGFHLPGDAPDLQCVHLKTLDASIATITPSTIGFVSHRSILAICEDFPRLTTAFWRHTLVDAAIFREWMANIGQRPAPTRIAHLLCELVIRLRSVGLAERDIIDFPITQRELGDAMGLSSVHVNRTLKSLRSERLFTLKDGVLEILDWKGLLSAGDFSPGYLHLRTVGDEAR